MPPTETAVATPAVPRVTPRAATPAASGSAAVDVRELNAWFGAQHAVRGVSVDFRDREVTAIIGPSGCGKSTLLRCLNRMHETVPTARVEGQVLLHGTDVYGERVSPIALRRHVGMVFQRPSPFPTMSIRDNVAAGLRVRDGRKPSRAETDAIVERSLRRAALWDEVKDRLRTSALALSGGQQQRLCIARALAVEPEVILLDEPASALDPISTSAIEDLMHELKQDFTLVIVTHNMQQAARVADLTAFFSLDELDGDRAGVLVEYDDTAKIFTQPSDPRTEGYVTGRFG